MTPYQKDVNEFHACFQVPPTGDYEKPRPIEGKTLNQRLKWLLSETEETARGLNAGDIVEIVDGLLDMAYIALGTFDIAGIVASPRFAEIIATGSYNQPWPGLTMHVSERIAIAIQRGRGAADSMAREYNRGWAFQQFEILDVLLKNIADAFTVMRIDPRPHWTEVQRSNMSKFPATYDEDGKLQKGPNYSPPDIAGILRAQGVL